MRDTFCQRFGENETPIQTYFAPGRVNLIGEHIDYNGGLVMPMAIEQGIKAYVRPSTEPVFRMQTLQSDGELLLDWTMPNFEKRKAAWQNYPLGVIDLLMRNNWQWSGGLEILLESTLPIGSGLSSSAAIEVLTSYILLDQAADERIKDRIQIAKWCQEVENEFVGVKCGIMDQFAVAMGQEGQAMLLACDTLAYQYVPFSPPNYTLLLLNTNKERKLADSKYNERKASCEQALAQLQMAYPQLEHLCAASPDAWKELSDHVLQRRTRHVISEQQRVVAAKGALANGDWHFFGNLMTASHRSLQHDYEVTGKELDAVVNAALEEESCLGARMTGAGFGGCAIALVRSENEQAFIEQVSNKYQAATGLNLSVLASRKAGAGVGLL